MIFPTNCWVRRAAYDPSGAYVGQVLVDLCRPSDSVTMTGLKAGTKTPNSGTGTGQPPPPPVRRAPFTPIRLTISGRRDRPASSPVPVGRAPITPIRLTISGQHGRKKAPSEQGPNGARKSAPVLGGKEKARQTCVTQELFPTRRAREGPCPRLDRAAPANLVVATTVSQVSGCLGRRASGLAPAAGGRRMITTPSRSRRTMRRSATIDAINSAGCVFPARCDDGNQSGRPIVSVHAQAV